jgi:hypothetical protein
MTGIVESSADWRGPDMLKRTDWIHHVTGAEADEILTSLRNALSRGVNFDTISRENFPLPHFGKVLAETLDFLENGPGLMVLRGLPIGGLSKDDARLLYWGLGKHLGTAVSQSKDGDLLGDVRDFGSDITKPDGRGYKSRQQLSYHTDSCDVVGLLVLRVARQGGLSIIASSTAVHNEIARQRPDLLKALYEPFPWSWNRQEVPGESPWYLQPLFSLRDGKLSCRYIRMQVLNSQRFEDAPRLTEQQLEAMALFDRLASSDEFRLTMMFEPGDMQLLNNHVMLHSRTSFEDYMEEDRKRHLLRMWLSVPNSRALSPLMSAIYRDQQGGAVRGGFPSRTGQHHYRTLATVTTD